MKKVVYKSYQVDIKSISVKGRTVSGYFSTFGNIDSDNEVIVKGAFAKSIAENGPDGKDRILHLYGHNRWDGLPVGKLKVLREDEIGLYFESEIVDTAFNNDILSHYKAGTLKEHSIGFYIINSYHETVNEVDIRYITEVKLLEGSTVLWGANEEAKITGIKSYDSIYNELEDIKESLSKLIAEKKQDEPEPEGITTQKAIEILTNQLNLN